MERRARIQGALIGVHVGDALGCTVEFASHGEIQVLHPEGVREIVGGGPFGWAPGHATDDTELTRAVLLAYLKPGTDVVTRAADLMVSWAKGTDWPDRLPGTRPPDIGRATELGLANYQASHDARRCGAGKGQAGNGSLMRTIATAICQPDFGARMRESMEISAITHDDPWCTVACAAYNEVAFGLLNGESVESSIEAGVACAHELGSADVVEAIERGKSIEISNLANSGPRELRANAAGLVLDSLTIAISAIRDTRSFEDILIDVVRIGRDTDTNAAIAGGLLGARDGLDAIPERWINVLQYRDEFLSISEQLCPA